MALRRELWQYVRQLRERGTTIVLTTHYLEEAEALADRVGVIDQGRLITVDSPRGLLRRHGKRRLRVTFSQPLAAGLQLPEALQRAGAEVDQARTILTCPLDSAALAPLLAAVSTVSAAVLDIETEQPSLEQVFLELTAGAPGAPP